MPRDLHEAVTRGDIDAARTFLTAGASANEDEWGSSAMDEAVARKDVEMVALLVQFGGDLEGRDANHGGTRLHAATDIETVSLLLRLGLDPNAVDHHGWTRLHFCAAYDDRETARALLDDGADPRARTATGMQPADIARRNSLAAADWWDALHPRLE